MRNIEINSSCDPLYQKFITLYASSFPIFEQRTEEQQETAFNNSSYHLLGYEENNVFIGFISYWEFDDYLYVEHFAINAALRGRGYGSKVLDKFTKQTDKTILLEVDPIVDDVTTARLRFYQRCGFFKNPHQHKHPAYRNGFKPHSLIVLTTKGQISTEEYQNFKYDLETVVMKH